VRGERSNPSDVANLEEPPVSDSEAQAVLGR
jgi:hypothetical protein